MHGATIKVLTVLINWSKIEVLHRKTQMRY